MSKPCDCSLKNALSRSVGGFAGYASDKLYDLGAKKFKSWTGYGDYTINSNSLVNRGSGGGEPILETRGRSIRISYREYLGEVTTGPTIGAFNATSFTVNPANVLTFPWLAPIAQQFDQYKPMGIIFEFKSTASDSVTGVALGSVIMATEYDVGDATYTSKQEMLNSAYSSECKASENLIHGLECDPNELQRKVFYTRRLNASVSDARDYDMAVFTVATQGGGLAANQSIGSLYVHYEFELLKEQQFGGLSSKDRFWSIYNTPTAVNAGLRGFDPYYGSTPASMRNALVAGIDMGIYVSGASIFFPRRWAGQAFKILVNATGTTKYDIIGTTPGISTGLTVIQQPTIAIGGNTAANTASWTNIATNSPGGGLDTMSVSATVVVLLDVLLASEYAALNTTQMGFMPIFGSSGLSKCRLEIEIIPSSWYNLS